MGYNSDSIKEWSPELEDIPSICYKCEFISMLIQLGGADNDRPKLPGFERTKINPEDIAVIAQYLLLGSFMLFGR